MLHASDIQRVLIIVSWCLVGVVALQAVFGLVAALSAREARAQQAGPAVILLLLLLPAAGLILWGGKKASVPVLACGVLVASFPMVMALDPIFREKVPMRNPYADAKGQFDDADLQEMAKYIWRGDIAAMRGLEAKGNAWRAKDTKHALLVYAAAEALQPDHGIEPLRVMLELGQSPRQAAEAAQILHRAASDTGERAAQVLGIWLLAGADANALPDSGEPALHAARRFPDRVRLLLAHGAQINRTDRRGYTALMAAAQDHSGWPAAMVLLEAGADIAHRAPDGLTVRDIVDARLREVPQPPPALAALHAALTAK